MLEHREDFARFEEESFKKCQRIVLARSSVLRGEAVPRARACCFSQTFHLLTTKVDFFVDRVYEGA